MTEKNTDFDPATTKTITIEADASYFRWSQPCMLCENSREVPHGYGSHPWICDECREAMAFLKDFMKSCTKAQDMLNEMEESGKNVHPL
jgi:hypothetical protein